MGFGYEVAVILGYFLPMLLFVVLAIISAKSWAGWLLLAIGSIVQLFSLTGLQKAADYRGTDMSLYWLIYIGLLIVAATIISKRFLKTKAIKELESSKKRTDENQMISDAYANESSNTPSNYSEKPTKAKSVEYRAMMNESMGTKWFFFFTKVRPVLGVIAGIPVIADYFRYPDTVARYFWLMLALLLSIGTVIINIVTAIKSDRRYDDFVEYVRYALIFEAFTMAYIQAVNSYAGNGFDLGRAIITYFAILLLMLLVWYLPNMRYFKRRLVSVIDEGTSAQAPAMKSSRTKRIKGKFVAIGVTVGSWFATIARKIGIEKINIPFLRTKKALRLAIILVAASLLFAMIGDIGHDRAWDEIQYAQSHYEATRINNMVGCGSEQCKYCRGVRLENHKGYYNYSDLFVFNLEHRSKADAFQLMTDISLVVLFLSSVYLIVVWRLNRKQKKKAQVSDNPAPAPVIVTPCVKFCRKCGAKLVEDSDFCNKCGTKVIKE